MRKKKEIWHRWHTQREKFKIFIIIPKKMDVFKQKRANPNAKTFQSGINETSKQNSFSTIDLFNFYFLLFWKSFLFYYYLYFFFFFLNMGLFFRPMDRFTKQIIIQLRNLKRRDEEEKNKKFTIIKFYIEWN